MTDEYNAVVDPLVLVPVYRGEQLVGRCGGWGVTQVDPLGLVQLLLHLEDVEVEVLLQLLVGEVDQQLLEAIVLKDLEAEDVEDA